MLVTSDFLFTYGTLMSGYDNAFAERLKNLSEFHDKGTIPGTLYKVSWYPGAVYQKNSGNVVYGEIYRLSNADQLLPELDEYEDVFDDETASLYLRKIVPVTLTDGTILHCWAYIYNQSVDQIEIIDSGDFRKL